MLTLRIDPPKLGRWLPGWSLSQLWVLRHLSQAVRRHLAASLVVKESLEMLGSVTMCTGLQEQR